MHILRRPTCTRSLFIAYCSSAVGHSRELSLLGISHNISTCIPQVEHYFYDVIQTMTCRASIRRIKIGRHELCFDSACLAWGPESDADHYSSPTVSNTDRYHSFPTLLFVVLKTNIQNGCLLRKPLGRSPRLGIRATTLLHRLGTINW